MRYALTVACFLLTCCGSGASSFESDVPTDTPPTITRIDPATGTSGQTVTIFGFGFSLVPQNNAILIGDTSVTAETYALVDPSLPDEIEQLTFVVPDGMSIGDHSITLVVGEYTSNSDILFSVTP